VLALLSNKDFYGLATGELHNCSEITEIMKSQLKSMKLADPSVAWSSQIVA